MEQYMKKMTALLLVCIAMLFWTAGCGNSGDPAETTEPAVTTESGISTDPALWPTVAKDYAAGPIMEADPNREFYISLQNQDCDFYPGAPYNGVFFYIITKQAYSPDEIKVSFPGQTKCIGITVTNQNDTFQQIPISDDPAVFVSSDQMPYHYLCLQDIDLAALAQKKSDAGCASAAYNALVAKNQATDEDFKRLVEGYIMPYQALYDQYIGEYKAQSAERLTDHSAYRINILFDPEKYAEETVEHIDITFGGNTHRVEFGQWRFHQENWPTSGEDTPGVLMYSMGVVGVSDDSPYAQGYLRTPQALRFKATEDIVLTGLRCTDGTNATVLGAKLESASAEASMDLYWDGTSALTLKAGTNVTGSVYFYSDIFKEYEMGMTTTIFIDYIVAATGETHTLSMPCLFPRNNNLWDTYCLAFLGEDVGEYYYYLPGDMLNVYWIREIPEDWRAE